MKTRILLPLAACGFVASLLGLAGCTTVNTVENAQKEGQRQMVTDLRAITDGSLARKVSIVGVGMKSHTGVAGMLFETLAKEGINIDMISTSEIKISIIIDLAKGEQAVKAVHAAFIG